jgi:hypothetical protein
VKGRNETIDKLKEGRLRKPSVLISLTLLLSLCRDGRGWMDRPRSTTGERNTEGRLGHDRALYKNRIERA